MATTVEKDLYFVTVVTNIQDRVECQLISMGQPNCTYSLAMFGQSLLPSTNIQFKDLA